MDQIKEIMESFFEEIKKKEPNDQRRIEMMEELFSKNLPDITNILVKSLKERSHIMLNDHRFIDEGFYARHNQRWFEAFDLLQEFYVISYEIGEEIGKDGEAFNTEESAYLFDVLLRLHARSIQITKEILVLMQHGYADGAVARWRTLHEITIISLFIAKHGNKTAKLYKEFNQVESYREMLSYNNNYKKLGFEPLSNNEKNRIREDFEKLKAKYGNDFVEEYGWTKLVLEKKDRSLSGIEKSIELDHMRPFYKWACNAVHGGPKAAYYKIGNYGNPEVLLAGPTNYGLADPGQNTALSLLLITSSLVVCFPTYDHIVAISALDYLFDNLKNKFYEIQKLIENEEDEKLIK
jgi:hypothetical protein